MEVPPGELEAEQPLGRAQGVESGVQGRGLYQGWVRAGLRVCLVWFSGTMTSVAACVQYHHISKDALGLASSTKHHPDLAIYLVI